MLVTDPFFSIILPAFNASNTISGTLKSIEAQVFRDFELVIVNDGSTDNTLKILNEFKNKFSNYKIISQENHGVAASRNAGISVARGKYIAFLDADDEWRKEKLFQHWKLLTENTECIITYTDVAVIDSDGRELLTKVIKPSLSLFDQLCYNHITLSSSVVKRESLCENPFKQIGHEDYCFWLDLFKMAKPYEKIIKTEFEGSLTKYRVHRKSLSANKLIAAKWHWNIIHLHGRGSIMKYIFFLIYVVNGIKQGIILRLKRTRNL